MRMCIPALLRSSQSQEQEGHKERMKWGTRDDYAGDNGGDVDDGEEEEGGRLKGEEREWEDW